MPETAENVAEQFSISRFDQDLFAVGSQTKARKAQLNRRLSKEIVPVNISDRKGELRTVEVDEHPRDTTIEALGKLQAPFRKNGTVTAGNASGVNDGAAALILASDEAVRKYGLKPLVRILGGASVGVLPRIMGFGPAPATAKLLHKLKLSIGDIGVFEFNEAFASQCLASMRDLGLSDDDPRVNQNGGAIALGHPLGMSGARLAGSAAIDAATKPGTYAVAAMCIGVGQGIAIGLQS